MGKLRRLLDEYICCCWLHSTIDVPLYGDDEEAEHKPFNRGPHHINNNQRIMSSSSSVTPSSNAMNIHKTSSRARRDSDAASDASDTSSYASPSDRNYHIGVPSMSKQMFEELRNRVREKTHDDERVEFLVTAMTNKRNDYGVTCEQVSMLLNEISFSTMKQECLESLLPFITDIANRKQQEKYILSQVEFHSDKQALKEKIDHLLHSKRKL